MPPVIPSRIFFPETPVISSPASCVKRKTRILSEFHGDHRLAPAGAAARAAPRAGSFVPRRRRAARDPAAHRREGEERGGSGAATARALRLGLRPARRCRGSCRNTGPRQRQARAAEGGARARAAGPQGRPVLARRLVLATRGARLSAPRARGTRAGSLRGAAARCAAPRDLLPGAVPRHADPDERLSPSFTVPTESATLAAREVRAW